MKKNRIRICGRKVITAPTPAIAPSTSSDLNRPRGSAFVTSPRQPRHALADPIHRRSAPGEDGLEHHEHDRCKDLRPAVLGRARRAGAPGRAPRRGLRRRRPPLRAGRPARRRRHAAAPRGRRPARRPRHGRVHLRAVEQLQRGAAHRSCSSSATARAGRSCAARRSTTSSGATSPSARPSGRRRARPRRRRSAAAARSSAPGP